MFTLSFEGIDIQVNKKKVKQMILRICSVTGVVKLSAPLRSSEASIHRFAAENIGWVEKHLLSFKSCPILDSQRYVIQGREYVLRVHEGHRKGSARLSDDTYLDLFIPRKSSLQYRERILSHFYKNLLHSELLTLIPRWENRIGQKADAYQIRLMKSRWGSCCPHKRKICLNLSLIKFPIICLEYVLVHELVHLLEASHNARFKKLMDHFMPNWRIYKAILDNPMSKESLFELL